MDLLIVSTITGLTTLLGACLVLMLGQPGKKALAFYLGVASGIMVLVVLVDLLPAAFASGPVQAIGIGLGLGLFVMLVISYSLHHFIHDQVVSIHPSQRQYSKMGWLVALAISFHNIPEGIAIGAGFESETQLGLFVAIAIALHNIPEGVGMAVPFRLAGMRIRWIALIALFASICIPFGAWLGKLFFVGSAFSVTMGIAFACGAMGYIVFKEIGPTSLREHRFSAQLGMAVGLLLMYLVHLLR
jgi:zinc transporter, ZIP family